MATGLPHDNVMPFNDPDKPKKQQIAEMFDRIAGRYDVTNRVLSAGIDVKWRKKAILQLKKDMPRQILDVATGTGDMAIISYELLKPEKITGIDISQPMMDKLTRKLINDPRHASYRYRLQQADATQLPFEDESFDVILTVRAGGARTPPRPPREVP